MAETYTAQDKAFLKALKDKGVSPQDAFTRLKTVKQKTQGPSNPTSSNSPAVAALPKEDYGILQPLRDATAGWRKDLDAKPASELIKEYPAIKPLADIATSPIGKEVARMSGSAIMGAGEGLANSAAAIYDVVDPFKKTFEQMKLSMPDKAAEIDEAYQKISGGKILRDLSQNLSGQTNQAVTESTGIDKDSISGNIGGATGKLASMIPGFAAAKGVGQAVGGALGFGAESAIGTQSYIGAEEGRLATPVELGVGVATDWALGKVLNKLFKTKGTASQADAVSDAIKTGISEKDAYLIADLDDKGQKLLKDYLGAGVDKLQDRSAGGVYDFASQDIGKFMDDANVYKNQIGKQLGEAKTALGNVDVPTDNITRKIDDIMERFNVKMVDKKLNFKSSELSNPQVQSLIDRLFKYRKTLAPVNARDLEAVTGQIDEAIGTLSGAAPKKTPSYKALKDLKTAINQTLSEADPAFGELNKQYAKVAEQINLIENVAKEKVGNTKQFNPSQLIRRSTSNLGNKYQKAIESISELGELMGKPAPEDIALRANLAELAERITQTKNATSLGGIMGSTGEQIADKAKGAIVKAGSKLPVIGGMIDAGAELLNKPSPQIEKNVARIIDFLDNNSAKSIIDTAKLSKAGEKSLEETLKEFIKDTKDRTLSKETLGGALKFLLKAGLINSV